MASGDTIANVFRVDIKAGQNMVGWPSAVSLASFHQLKDLPDGIDADAKAHTAANFEPSKKTRSTNNPDPNDNLYRWVDVQIQVTMKKTGNDPFNHCWVLKDEVGDSALQRHEQGHFDLVGLAARDYCAELLTMAESSISMLHAENVNQKSRYDKLLHLLNEVYEEHTQNGSKPEKQAIWEGAIQSCKTYGSHIGTLLAGANLMVPGIVKRIADEMGLS